MTVFLDVDDNSINAGDTVTWSLDQDVVSDPETDSIWMVDADNDAGIYAVPDWSGEQHYEWTEQFPGGGEYGRYILAFTSGGTAVEGSEGVTIHVAEQPPSEPPGEPPGGGGTPPGGGGTPPGGGGNPPPATPPPTTGIPAVDAILADISARLQQVADFVGGIAQQISDGLAAAIEGLVPSTLEVLAGTNTALAAFIGSFNQNLIKAPDYWALLTAQLRGAFEATDEPHVAFLRDVVVPAADEWLLRGGDDYAAVISDWLQQQSNDSSITDAIGALSGRLGQISSSGGWLAGTVTVALVQSILSGAVARAYINGIEQNSLREIQNTKLTPAEAASAVVQGAMDASAGQDEATYSGIDGDRFAALVAITGSPPGPQELFDLWNRGVISEDQVNLGLLQSRLKPEWVDAIKNLRVSQVSPSDLVRFLVREVFSESRGQLQLDADYPGQSADDEFLKIGISPELARNYWAAHWQLPSLTEAFEMFHRSIIGDSELDALMKAQDYSPAWRDSLKLLSFNPLTRVDIRRMHKSGVLTDDDLVAAYLNIGYSPQDADRMKTFTIALNTQEVNHNKLDVTSGMRQHLIGAYQNGVLAREEAGGALGDLGYDQPHIDALLTEADYTITASRFNKVRASVGRLFIGGEWTEDHARASLSDWGATPGEIEFLISDWNIDREFKQLSAEHIKQRDLTKAEIEEAFRDEILSETDATGMLVHLGYDDSEVETLLNLQRFRLIKARMADGIAAIHDDFLAHNIERSGASNALDAIGVNTNRRDSLLGKWTRERDGRQAHLSLATLEEMVRREIITDDEVSSELTAQHYNDTQISRLLRLWGSREQERKDKIESDIAAHIRHLSTQDVVREYKASVLDRDTAARDLAELKYEQDSIDALLTLTPRDLSAQQISSALKAGVIDRGLARDRLRNLGYTDGDAKILLDTAQGVHNA